MKLTLLSNATTRKEQEAAIARDYSRKFQELRYAVWVEDHYTKDQILEHYLNIAYFGDGAYGVQSAAHHYFNTTADKLTLPQAALLAGTASRARAATTRRSTRPPRRTAATRSSTRCSSST